MADYGNTATTSSTATRTSWNEMEEFDLLDKHFAARSDHSRATDKGIKPKGWTKIVADLNRKHQRSLDKGQYKSKYTRLMQHYDLYTYIIDLSGAGVCPDTGKPTLNDDMWKQLMTSKPKQKSKIAAIREHGFAHATVCCLIAGDTRATGEHATTVTSLAADLCRKETDDSNPEEADDGSRALVMSDTSAAAVSRPPTNTDELPKSHQQRVDKVKRIRGGALKSNRAPKKKKTDDEMTKVPTSLMRTTKAYMKMKKDAHRSQQPNANKENEPNQGNKSPDLQIWV